MIKSIEELRQKWKDVIIIAKVVINSPDDDQFNYVTITYKYKKRYREITICYDDLVDVFIQFEKPIIEMKTEERVDKLKRLLYENM